MRTEPFTVIYRRGGPAACSWHRVSLTFPTREEANDLAAEIERMGYKALVHETRQLDLVGMPQGWDWKSADSTLAA